MICLASPAVLGQRSLIGAGTGSAGSGNFGDASRRSSRLPQRCRGDVVETVTVRDSINIRSTSASPTSLGLLAEYVQFESFDYSDMPVGLPNK